MIRYYEVADVWVSNEHPDDCGMPSVQFGDSEEICDCTECSNALSLGLGRNFYDLFRAE